MKKGILFLIFFLLSSVNIFADDEGGRITQTIQGAVEGLGYVTGLRGDAASQAAARDAVINKVSNDVEDATTGIVQTAQGASEGLGYLVGARGDAASRDAARAASVRDITSGQARDRVLGAIDSHTQTTTFGTSDPNLKNFADTAGPGTHDGLEHTGGTAPGGRLINVGGSSNSNNPAGDFNFEIPINNPSSTTPGSFTEGSGLELETQPIEYRSGSQNITPRKISGLKKFTNLTLKRGAVGDTDSSIWTELDHSSAASIDEPLPMGTPNSQDIQYAGTPPAGEGGDLGARPTNDPELQRQIAELADDAVRRDVEDRRHERQLEDMRRRDEERRRRERRDARRRAARQNMMMR